MDHTILHKKRRLGGALRSSTISMNTVGYSVFDIEPDGGEIIVQRRRHGA